MRKAGHFNFKLDPTSEEYNWNYADNYVAGHRDYLQNPAQQLHFQQMNFFLIILMRSLQISPRIAMKLKRDQDVTDSTDPYLATTQIRVAGGKAFRDVKPQARPESFEHNGCWIYPTVRTRVRAEQGHCRVLDQ
jgi:hypothetical protein